MILKFPNQAVFRTVLQNQTSDSCRDHPARAGSDAEGALYLEPSVPIPRPALNEMRKAGADTVRSSPVPLEREVGCWPQLVPLEPLPGGVAVPEQAVVLFDLPSGQLLSQIALEILRLGNDRQSFRWLGEAPGDDETVSAGSRALLRVVGPPYYTLLRAIAPRDPSAAPRAFLERAARVWVEMGHDHPLATKIKPPADQILLLTAPDHWTYLPEAPFRDVYDVLEFNIPEGKVAWKDTELNDRLRVSMKLIRSGALDTAELWVLRDDPIEQLNAFVQASDDQILGRLAFAVGEQEGKKTIVLRVRPSKLPPPVLVLRAEAFAPYRKLPNLYLPCGWRLHPPLRRDVVRKKLADDPATLTWLYPAGDGVFVPETLADNAFRPLGDWVEYIIDHEQQALRAWIDATLFDFESFVCEEDGGGKPRKPPGERDNKPRERKPRVPVGRAEDGGELLMLRPEDEDQQEGQDDLSAFGEFVKQEPSQLEVRRRELEELFLCAEGNLDAPERQQLWPEMARVNAALNSIEDAGLCYANALWQGDEWDRRLAREWFQTEARAVPEKPVRNRPHRWTASGLGGGIVSAADLELLLGNSEPGMSDLRALAAYLVWAAQQPATPEPLAERLDAVQRFLAAHERLLPVRSCWLAWCALTQMTHGDVLALARARDRLLERLFQHGLRAEHDLPGFLRFAGQPTSQRFRGLRKWMIELCTQAHEWVKDIATKPPAGQSASSRGPLRPPEGPGTRATHAYIDLLFAFGLARLGEADATRDLVERADGVLRESRDDVHAVLEGAFRFRIEQVRDNKPPRGPWPAKLVEQMEQITDKMQRFRVDRLRERSRILEPEQKIDAYSPWTARTSELDRRLADVIRLQDRKALADGLLALLNEVGKAKGAPEARGRVLRAALDQSPRVGEEFAVEMLQRLGPTYDGLQNVQDPAVLVEQATLLEKGLFVAAHFDQKEFVQPLVGRFQKLLQSQETTRSLQELDKLAAQCFRGLRKLGMRDEIDLLLRQLAEMILGGKDIADFNVKADPNGPSALRALLHVAAGWYYFNRDREAEPILNATRNVLYKMDLAVTQQAKLACAYAGTVGQAPVEAAQKGLEELLQRLPNVWDNYTTGSHYVLSQLEVIEAVVLAVVNDEFTMGTDARRWLDDDEFLVRKRIHRDLRQMMSQTHH